MNIDTTQFNKIDLEESKDYAPAPALVFAQMAIAFVTVRRCVRISELQSRRRAQRLVEARAMFVWLVKHYRPGVSYPVIANWLGDRCHTGAMHLFQMASRLRQDDPAFFEDCEDFAAKYRRLGEVPYACD